MDSPRRARETDAMRIALWCIQIQRAVLLAVLLTVLLLAAPAPAFDGEREGLVLGGGVGAALSFVAQDVDEQRFDDFTRPGAALDLRIGWGFSEAVVVFGSFRGSWIRYDTRNLRGSDVVHGTLGVGMTQHLDRGRSDWYSTGHLGLAFFELLEEDVETLTGFGFGGGMGREWRSGLAVEALAGWESTSTDIDQVEFGISTISLRLQLVATAY